jgi:hypothetical protein
MDLVLDLLQGAGIAAAVGIRPFLPVLLAGALAAANLGLDFDGTDFAFLEAPGFLLAIVVLLAVTDLVQRRAAPDAADRAPWLYGLLAVALVLGALQAAGSMADRDHPVGLGAVVGLACAALGFFAVRPVLARVRRRLGAEAGLLPFYAEAAALAAAGLSILFPPAAVLVVGGLLWLLLGSRRREGEKYAGLRILR